MNIKLLRKIQRRIARTPLRFDMAMWIDPVDEIAPCGTAACIGGHAIIIDLLERKRIKKWVDAYDAACILDAHGQAARLLRLNPSQADRLFHLSEWPAGFLGCMDRTTLNGRKEHARLAIKRIDHFIDTKGAE